MRVRIARLMKPNEVTMPRNATSEGRGRVVISLFVGRVASDTASSLMKGAGSWWHQDEGSMNIE
ncbi:MAG: hypothetical protein EBV94_07090 [Actinobacteria bacterium]|nr:hypothetical protein [Actinomycetota bacterium]